MTRRTEWPGTVGQHVEHRQGLGGGGGVGSRTRTRMARESRPWMN